MTTRPQLSFSRGRLMDRTPHSLKGMMQAYATTQNCIKLVHHCRMLFRPMANSNLSSTRFILKNHANIRKWHPEMFANCHRYWMSKLTGRQIGGLRIALNEKKMASAFKLSINNNYKQTSLEYKNSYESTCKIEFTDDSTAYT